jgi:uncharacterized membrane protein
VSDDGPVKPPPDPPPEALVPADTEVARVRQHELQEVLPPGGRGRGAQPDQPPGTVVYASYSSNSPLPPPDWMQGYKNIQEDLPGRLIKVMETEGEHRRDMERKEQAAEERALDASMRNETIGMCFGFTLGAGGLLTAAYLTVHGNPVGAGFIGSGALGSLVLAFIRTKRRPPSGGDR